MEPVCFVKPNLETLGDKARACDLDYFLIRDVWFHHFSHVRLNFNRVLEKIMTSHIWEQFEYADMSKWIPEVYNKLPEWNKKLYPDGFHPNNDFRHNWKGIKVVERAQLPEILRKYKFKIMERFSA